MKTALIQAIHAACGLPVDTITKNLTTTKDTKYGDLAFPCFLLAKEWKLSPVECAEKLRTAIKLPEGFSKAISEGPYLNFFFDRAREISRVTGEILKHPTSYGSSGATSCIVVDYSGPNISKPFHVGNLRTKIIGFALYNLYKHLCHRVIGVNHLGDWGTQFGFVYSGCSLWGKPA